MCNINLKVYSCILKVLNKGIIRKESMPLLPFKRGIQVIYVIWLKWGYYHLVKVCNYLAWLDSYKYVNSLYFKV